MKKTNSREETTSYEFDSSVINKASYNYDKNALTIQFSNGSIYEYSDVEVRVFNEFVDAKSQGTYFTENIKENYTYNKL